MSSHDANTVGRSTEECVVLFKPFEYAVPTPEPSSLALGLAAVASIVVAWAWVGRDMTPSQKAAMDRGVIEAYRDNDPLL